MTREQANSHLLITRKQQHADAPRPVTPIGIDSLDGMVGQHIRWEYQGLFDIRTGVVLDWFQKEHESVLHTWLLVSGSRFEVPVWVHWSRFRGFSSMFVGVR